MKNIKVTASMNIEPITVLTLGGDIIEITTLREFLEICDHCDKHNLHLVTHPNSEWTNRDFIICFNESISEVKKGFFARLFNR